MVPVIPTGTKSPKEVGRAKEAPTAEAGEIAVMVTKNNPISNIYFKEKWKIVWFQNQQFTEIGHEAT